MKMADYTSGTENPLPLDSETVILNFTSKDTGDIYMISNTNPGFDMGLCLKGPEVTGLCEKCSQDVLEGLDILGEGSDQGALEAAEETRQACTDCALAKAQCYRTSGIVDNTEVSYMPEGDYTLNAMVMNMPRVATLSQEKPYQAMPLYTETIDVTLPRDDADVLIKIEDSDKVYEEAINTAIREAGAAERKCIRNCPDPILGSINHARSECKRACRKAAPSQGIMAAMEFITEYKLRIDVEVY